MLSLFTPFQFPLVPLGHRRPARDLRGGRFRIARQQLGLCLVLGLASVAVLWGLSLAEHTAALRWMAGYTSAEGVGCCAEHDCLPWPVAVVQFTGDHTTVRIGETVVELPRKSVHATQDGQTYWCCTTDAAGHCPQEPTRATTRCVFYAVGM
jgi:hypothetical protein